MTTVPARARLGVVRAAILAGGLVVSWLIIRDAAIREWGETDPALAAAFLPAGAAPLAAMARARFVAAGGAADAETVRLVDAAFRAAPASAAPLILAGLAASAQGETNRALRLMRMARGRDPSEATARYWLLDHHIRTGNYAAGLEEIGPAIRLRPEAQPAIFALVAGLYDVPGARGAVSRALGLDPDWRAAFFTGQSVGARRPLALLQLLRDIPPARDPAAAAAEQRSVLYAAMQIGAYDEAYAAWREFLPAGARPIAGAVYDPAFRGRPGPEPFNWILRASGDPRASIVPAGAAEPAGLEIVSNGSARAIVAEQYVLASGRRELSVSHGSGTFPSGTAIVRVACARDDAPLVELPIEPGPSPIRNLPFRNLPSRTRALFSVPPACGAIRVQIVILPAERPSPVSVRITEVRIDPA